MKSLVGTAIIALIQATIQSYMVIYTSAETSVYDSIPEAVFEYNGPCDFVNGANTWKLLVADMVFLVLLDFTPFVGTCVLNIFIIRTMKRQAENWGREDPQKLVISYSILDECF